MMIATKSKGKKRKFGEREDKSKKKKFRSVKIHWRWRSFFEFFDLPGWNVGMGKSPH
jgi:hypothetical protein